MTTYTWPLAYKPADFFFRPVPNTREIDGMFSASQTIEFPGCKWRAVMTLPPASHPDRAGMEAWLNRIRGPAHRVKLWHMARPVPRGTLQANTTTNGTAAQFAQSVSLAATTGLTLLAGDMIEVALENSTTQLLMAAEDTVSVSGTMVVAVTTPLAWSVASGAAVTVVRPTATFKLLEAPGTQYVPGHAPQLPIEFQEV